MGETGAVISVRDIPGEGNPAEWIEGQLYYDWPADLDRDAVVPVVCCYGERDGVTLGCISVNRLLAVLAELMRRGGEL
jgi:hypothetical protein